MLTIALALRVLTASPEAFDLADELSDALVANCDQYDESEAPLYCDPTIGE